MSDDAFMPITVLIVGAFIISMVVTDKSVNDKEMALANYKCTQANSSLKYLEMAAFGMDVTCENGATFDLPNEFRDGFIHEYHKIPGVKND